MSDDDEDAWSDECAAFAEEGLVFPVRGLFTEDRLCAIDALLSSLVNDRPASLKPEDLVNLHLTVPAVLELCREPRALSLARRLLGCADISVFTSRVLCKLPGGREIPWHQDSLYWPLEAPSTDSAARGPVVASLWLTLDDIHADSGVMEVVPYSAAPCTRGASACGRAVVDTGGSTRAFDNFNKLIDVDALGARAARGARRVVLRRGEAEWHSAFVVHRSAANTSAARRRLAWIVRYVPTGTVVVPGVRDAFDAAYPLVPVCGRGAERSAGVRFPDARDRYAPCFGNSVAALLK
jgi:ectoine hydroxylase-related dioxygenase (phytanoyl-CoA dioxygenase family)